jgi:hypothetical protein
MNKTVFKALRCYSRDPYRWHVLSVCCLSSVPRRLAAVLAILRPVADEIVVAIDDRTDPALLGLAAELADHAFRVPYADPPERTFAWLHEQTSGDWVFRIDDDEAPSQALLDLLSAPPFDVTHCFVRRRWLWREGYLDAFPWRPDWQLRFARREALQFPGLMHVPARASGPARYVEAPIYHLDLVENDRPSREVKARRYDALRRGVRVGGRPLNEAYYLPESRDAPVAPLPSEDAGLVHAVREAPEPSRAKSPALGSVTREEIDAHWAARPLSDEAYRARLDAVPPDPFAAGEVRAVDVRVTNLGTETWAYGPDGLPEIRISSEDLPDALRTPLPHDLAPDQTALVPVSVRAPEEPGRHAITLDLVHEGHRWFRCGTEVVLHVLPRRLAVLLVGQPPGEEAFDARVEEVLAGLDPALEPVLVGPKPDWLRHRFGVEAQIDPPPEPAAEVHVLPAGRRRDRLRLELLARRLRRHARG